MEKEDLIKTARSLVKGINSLPANERTSSVFELEDVLKGIEFGEDNKVEGFVYVTKNLVQFKDIKGNRIINENSSRVQKLANSIERIGVIAPVIVNEEYGVVDGQRRLRALRRYGLPHPVTYVRKPDLDITVVGEINQLQDKWNHKDWLNRYSADGNESYQQYMKIAKEYEPYMRSRSLRGLLMLNRVDPLPSGVWENGEFVIDRNTLAANLKFLEFLKKVFLVGDKENIFAKDRNFQKALHELYKRTKNLDEDRLLVKFRTHFGRINVRVDFKTYRKLLADVYNARLASDKHHVVVKDEEERPPLELKMAE